MGTMMIINAKTMIISQRMVLTNLFFLKIVLASINSDDTANILKINSTKAPNPVVYPPSVFICLNQSGACQMYSL